MNPTAIEWTHSYRRAQIDGAGASRMIAVILWIAAIAAMLLAVTALAAVVLNGQISRELRGTRMRPGGRTDSEQRRGEHE